ncbi:MAG: amidohydrolase [Variibacter sp.]
MAEKSQTYPRLKAPAGLCDTHIHIYDRRFPTAPTATMTPPDAGVGAYKEMCRRVGIARTIVVQPTTYGLDNRCTLDAVAALGETARGIAVVDETVTDDELARLSRGGMCGVRFHQLPGGALKWEQLDAIAARVQPFGWHIQLQLDGRDLPKYESAIRRFPGTLVIDHIGKFLEPVATDHAAFRILLALVERGNTYVKLSAPYETSKAGPPNFDDVGAMAKALLRAAPERMLWASNWPHPSAPADAKSDDAMLLDVMLDWVPDEVTRLKVLVDNPARLYGF